MSAKVIPLKKPRGKFERIAPNYFRYEPTGVIYYREKFGKLGVPLLFQPTGETTLGRAKTAATKLRTDWISKHTGQAQVFNRSSDGSTVGEVIDDILERHTPRQRPMTQVKHKQYLAEIRARFGRYDVKSLTSRDLEDWIRDIKRRGPIEKDGRKWHRTSFDDCVKHLNLVARWAQSEGYSPYLLRFKNPEGKAAKTYRVYSDAEVTALWEAMSEDARDKFVLSYECMMRLREALRLTWDRVDLKTGKVTLRAQDVKTGSKTGKGRELILSPGALERLRARRAAQPRATYVFASPSDPSKPVDSIKTAWRSAKADAKIRGRARWHDLRHTAISNALLVAKVPPLIVSEYAGVSMQTIQRVYLHSSAELTRAAASAVSVNPKRGKQGVKGHAGR